MQIQTLSPFYVLSLPLIHPIITVSSFRHFSFTRSFFLTNAFLSVSPFIPFYLSFYVRAPDCLFLCFQLYSLCLSTLSHHALGFCTYATLYFTYNSFFLFYVC